MTYVNTVAPEAASGLVRELYDKDLASKGYIASMTRLYSLRPEVAGAWEALIVSIRKNMRLRRYELATIAAASALKCSYCLLAHGSILAANGFTPEEVVGLATDPESAPIEPVELAIMRFAAKVALDAGEIGEADVEALRAFGLTDTEIFDIVLAASARAFYSKSLDAMDTEPDHAYVEALGTDVANRLAALGRPLTDVTLVG